MTLTLLDAGSLPYRRTARLQRAETFPPFKGLGEAGIAVGTEAGTPIILQVSATSLEAGPVSPTELEFWLERQAFDMIPRGQLTQYEGRFVASRGGQIVDSDTALERLTERFFGRFGDVPVYMTRIGQEPDIRIDTPFFD